MNDDNRTRILRPKETPVPGPSDPTQKIGHPTAPTNSFGETDYSEDVSTRVISSHGSKRDAEPAKTESYELAAGWLVVVEGPGRGCTREIYYGMNSIGRGAEERIPLDFGDTAISREAHAYLVFDEKQSDFYLQHGGKSNLVRLNDVPVLSPQTLKIGDIIEIGGTKLRFVPLCGDDFKWEESGN